MFFALALPAHLGIAWSLRKGAKATGVDGAGHSA